MKHRGRPGYECEGQLGNKPTSACCKIVGVLCNQVPQLIWKSHVGRGTSVLCTALWATLTIVSLMSEEIQYKAFVSIVKRVTVSSIRCLLYCVNLMLLVVYSDATSSILSCCYCGVNLMLLKVLTWCYSGVNPMLSLDLHPCSLTPSSSITDLPTWRQTCETAATEWPDRNVEKWNLIYLCQKNPF